MKHIGFFIATLCVSMVLAMFSAGVMNYISMAAIIGPWVAPVLVLVVMIACLPLLQKTYMKESIALMVAGGSVGGIIATAIGFTLPAWYFFDQEAFAKFMISPMHVAWHVGVIVAVASACAFVCAYLFKDYLLHVSKLEFPIGGLVYNMIYSQDQKDSMQLMGYGAGISTSFMIIAAQTRFWLSSYFQAMQMGPLLFSIGFVAGHSIAVPLAIGMLTKLFALDVIRSYFFEFVTDYEFVVAFCSGMVLATGLTGVGRLVASMYRAGQGNKKAKFKLFLRSMQVSWPLLAGIGIIFILGMLLLASWGCSYTTGLYVMIMTMLSCFYMTAIAGALGLAQLGRFATFVMLPALYFFHVTYVQAVVISLFVAIATGLCVDLMFGYKLASLARIAYRRMVVYQIMGVVAAMCVVGFIFWSYTSVFELGSMQLFAQKAQARSLLIQLHTFNTSIVGIGCLFGLGLMYLGVGTLSVFGGVLMPLQMSIWLIVAGACSYFVPQKEQVYPFWFGLYAMHALLMMVQALHI